MSNTGSSGLFRRSSLPMSFSKSGEEKAFSSNATGFGRSRKECFVFEPQQWRKTVCKNCFRTHGEHKTPGENVSFSNTESKLSSVDNCGGNASLSTHTSSSATAPGTPIPSMCKQDPFKVPGQKETTNQNASRVAARKHMVGQRTNDELCNLQDSRRPNSGSSVNSNVHSSVSSIDAHYIEELENDFFALEDKHEAILRERSELKLELESKLRTIGELHTTLEQYREKVNLLERRSIHLEEEVKNYRERLRLPESEQSIQPIIEEGHSVGGNTDSPYSGELQQRLNEVEQLCQEVMEENEQLKEEVEEMQREIEEMHDHFQEDDRDTMRELQRDLEAANKTCRILQFKLRKAERRFEQCDAERANLEERLARLEAELYSEADVAHIRNLEEEIRVAKEVGVRLNNELDVLDEKRAFFEEENRQLKEELQACHNRRIAVENELGHRKLEIEKLRSENGSALQVADKNRLTQIVSGTSPNTGIPFEIQQLHRELEASRERETDVCEQLRYSEEEVRKMKRRLRETQMENEMAAKKMDRLLTMQLREHFAYGQTATGLGAAEIQQTSDCAPAVKGELKAELEMTKKQLEYMADENGELRRKLCMDEEQTHSERNSSKVANELVNLTSENDRLRNALKEWDKQLRVIVREVNLMNATERDQEWMKKYSEALETVKEQDDQIFRLKKRVSELQEDNSRLQTGERRMEQRQNQRRKRDKTGLSSHMSKESICHEITNLEEELDEVSAALKTAREQASSAQVRVTCLEENTVELRAENDRRERELYNYVFGLENKCAITNRLLELTRCRTESLQAEIDKLTSRSAEGTTVIPNGMSAQNEELERLKNTVAFLEASLAEERKRSHVMESQIEQRQEKSTNGCVPSTDGVLQSKHLELLKKELEEKDELLEAGSNQISDMKVRLEQARKMNDALRALLEKESDEPQTISPGIQKTELAVEVASYRKEMESLRKEMQILRTNLCQAKKLREKLAKENKELQEELKLREDSIFDQDDEIEKRTTEIQHLKTSMESLHKELEQAKQDLLIAKSRETSNSSGRVSAQTEKLRNELNETTKQLNDVKRLYEESQRLAVLAEEKFNQTCTELNQFRSSMQDRESKIFDLNMSLKHVTDELHQARDQHQSIESEKAGLTQQLMETMKLLTAREQELTRLRSQLQTASHEMSLESGVGLSEASTREGNLSRRSADVDRLRRELSLVQREREDLLTEVKRLRKNMEKQQHAKEFGQKGFSHSILSLPSGNAYAKAIAAKQVTTKISLLNEHISAVTRTNIELKLHNESMQNSVLDYQRRYRNLKEQYECEQEAWLTERVVLESKAKEQDDRKVALLTARQLLQETTIRLSEMEKSTEIRLADLQSAYKTLEEEKISIENKLTHLEEQQKLPKVLQRFGASNATSSRGVVGATSRVVYPENRDVLRRSENAERTIAKLRGELNEARQNKQMENKAVLQEADRARHLAEQEAEDLRDRLVTMECYRQQTELFRHRQFEVEEMAEKEFRLWQEEREQLLSRCEEAKVMVEHWCTQLQYRTDGEAETADEVVNDVVKQMDRWRSSRGRMPSIKQRVMMDSNYSFDGTSVSMVSVAASPSSAFHKPGGPGACSSFMRSSQTQRSTSMEWGNASNAPGRLTGVGGWINGGHLRESSLGLISHGTGGFGGGCLRGSTLSLATGGVGGSHQNLAGNNRCGRSVSPEVSVKKVSNYPDPTPGFLVRPTSRQGSQDSLCSIGDYTQRSFTLPGKPPMRSAISPARRKFLEDPSSVPATEETTKSPLLPAILSLAAAMEDSTKDKGSVRINNGAKEADMTVVAEKNEDRIPEANSSKSTSTKNKTEKESKSSKTKKKSDSKLSPLERKSTECTSASKQESIVDRFSRWSGNSALKSVGKLNSTRSSSIEPKGAPELMDNLQDETTGKQITNMSCDKKLSKQNEIDKKQVNTGYAPTSTMKAAAMTRSVSQPAPSITPSPQTSTKASMSVSNISPAIMALRQKFSGGGPKV